MDKWNVLPNHVVDSNSLAIANFKSDFDSFNLNNMYDYAALVPYTCNYYIIIYSYMYMYYIALKFLWPKCPLVVPVSLDMQLSLPL